MAERPLCGVRVIAVEQYGAGPFGSMFLADQGAEVIKIEHPGAPGLPAGDMARGVGPHFTTREDGTRHSLFFEAFNRNKASLALNLDCAAGRAVLEDLAAGADGLVSNLRGDVPDKLGLTYATLRHRNRALVCSHLSAYGRDGPRGHWPGYDYLMQAEAGWFSLTGEPATPPTRFGLSVVDLMAGLGMAYAFAAALVGARATGVGRDMDVSLFDMALHNLGYLATWYLNAGHAQGREARSAHPSLVPCQLYRTADGWIFLMCNKEKFWPALCEQLGREDLRQDARFTTFADRLAHRDLLTLLLDDALSARTTAEWLLDFAGKVPAAPVLGVADALDNPFVVDNNRLMETHAADGTSFRHVAPPVRSEQPPPAAAAPDLGADTDALLAGLGYSTDRIAQLRTAGVIQ